MAARSDDERRREATALRHHRHAVRALLHGGDAEAPAHVRAGNGCSLEQVVIELAANDAVARRAPPRRLVPPALELEDAGLERLDGERILLGIDLEIAEGLRSDPPCADLDPREDGGVEHEHPQPGAGEPPRGRAAPGPAAHHDDLEGRGLLSCRRRDAHALTPSTGKGGAGPSGGVARACPRPGWRWA